MLEELYRKYNVEKIEDDDDSYIHKYRYNYKKSIKNKVDIEQIKELI